MRCRNSLHGCPCSFHERQDILKPEFSDFRPVVDLKQHKLQHLARLADDRIKIACFENLDTGSAPSRGSADSAPYLQ